MKVANKPNNIEKDVFRIIQTDGYLYHPNRTDISMMIKGLEEGNDECRSLHALSRNRCNVIDPLTTAHEIEIPSN